MYGNNKFLLIVMLVICMTSYGFKCNKSVGCAEVVSNFEMGIKAYPDKDSILIGDTIWIEINEPVIFKDLTGTGTGNVDYSNAANLGAAISFAQLISVDSTNDKVASKFKYLLMSGSSVERQDTIKYWEYKFSEQNGFYRFKLALIPREKGVYKMFIGNANNVYRNNNKCTKANFIINFINTNQHYYFNKVSFPGIVLSGKTGVYLFKVN